MPVSCLKLLQKEYVFKLCELLRWSISHRRSVDNEWTTPNRTCEFVPWKQIGTLIEEAKSKSIRNKTWLTFPNPINHTLINDVKHSKAISRESRCGSTWQPRGSKTKTRVCLGPRTFPSNGAFWFWSCMHPRVLIRRRKCDPLAPTLKPGCGTWSRSF